MSLEGKRARYGFATLGDYYFVHERFADAERMFALSLQKQRHHDSYLGLAQAQAELGKEAEAVENLRRVLELDPTNPRALMLLGRYYYSKGQWRQAREIYVRFMRTPEGRTDPNVAGHDPEAGRVDRRGGEGRFRALRENPPAPGRGVFTRPIGDPARYSYRSASIGSSDAARRAGQTPKMIPTDAAKTNATAIDVTPTDVVQ